MFFSKFLALKTRNKKGADIISLIFIENGIAMNKERKMSKDSLN